MAKREKKDKDNNVEFNVEVTCPGFEELNGDILSITDEEVVVKARRKHSTKHERHRIAKSKVIAVIGEVGSAGVVTFRTETAFVNAFKGPVEEPVNGFYTMTHKDGSPVLINAQYSRVVGEDDSEGSPRRGRGASKSDNKKDEKKNAKKTSRRNKKGDDWEE